MRSSWVGVTGLFYIYLQRSTFVYPKHSCSSLHCLGNDYVQTLELAQCSDEVAEWLRRWTANPLGSARVGSNPIFVAIPLRFYGVMVSTLDFESSDPSSNLGRTCRITLNLPNTY